MRKLKIATEFSRIPGARYEHEGAFPGEDFREKHLYPEISDAIKSGEKLEIDLDGTAGLGTSFLEESFGGLIRTNKLSYNDIIKTLIFISEEEPDYIDEILAYLKDAEENEK